LADFFRQAKRGICAQPLRAAARIAAADRPVVSIFYPDKTEG